MNFFQFIFSKTFLKQLLFAAIVTVILVFLIIKWLNYRTNHGQAIEVPDLTALQLGDADKQLKDLHLNRVLLDSANYNPNFPKYSVIEQNPLPGKEVKKGRKIYLKLNPSGFPKIEMPNLIRNTKRQVIPTLRSLGFEVGDITYKPDIAKDAVLELRAEGKKVNPGDKIMKTTKIDLILGDGYPEGKKEEAEEEESNPAAAEAIQENNG